MTLTTEDKSKIINANHADLVCLSFGNFYIKKAWNDIEGINEVVSESIIQDFNVFTPKIYLANIHGSLYILSEDIGSKGAFKTAYSLGISKDNSFSLYGIWIFLESQNYVNPSALMFEIIKVYIFNTLFMLYDRHCNWGVLTIGEENHIAIFDNTEIFKGNSRRRLLTSYLDRSDYKAPFGYTNKKYEKEYLRLLKEANLADTLNFLKESSIEFQELFEYYYNLMTVEHFKDILDKVEKENSILTENGEKPLIIPNKSEMIKMYEENYKAIGELWEGLKHGRK